MTTKLAILTLLILIGLTSCKPDYEKIFEENTQRFDRNRPVLNKAVVEIEKIYLKNWDKQKEFNLVLENLDKQTNVALKKLGIGSVEITHNPNGNCDKKYWITFIVIDDWNIGSLRVVQLVYAPCDKSAIKDYHYYDGYHQDFWGQGENWFIYSDTDFI